MIVKFLILRFSSIGDIVLTTPVIRCLKEQVEGAEVHYATKKQFESVVANNPYIDKLHLLDGDLNKLIKELKNEEFHYIIDLHHNLRTLIIKFRLPGFAFSFNKINFEKWLMVQFKKNKLPQKHIVDRYLETCSLFDVVNDNKGLNFYIDPQNEIDPGSLPSNIGKKYIALVIGAKHATKQMPDEMLSELCTRLNYPVVLLGGPGDKEKAEAIMKASKNQNVYNASGKYNLQQSASLVKQSQLVISHDTGLMHISAAFQKKIISIWGNTIPEFGMFPFVPEHLNTIFEINNLPCRPCSKIGYQKCPKGHFKCMRDQDLNAIVKKVEENLNS